MRKINRQLDDTSERMPKKETATSPLRRTSGKGLREVVKASDRTVAIVKVDESTFDGL